MNKALWSSFLLASLFFVSPVFAGGQLVSLYADSDGWVSDTMYGRVLRVYLHPEYPCKGTQITFKFVAPKDGDYITTGSGNSTYVMQEDRQPYYKNGILGTTCSTYAKMGSKASEERQVTVEVKNGDSIWHSPPVIKVHFDGKYHGDNHTDGESYRSSIDDPYWSMTSKSTPIPSSTSQPTLSGSIYVKVGNQKYIEGPKRQVTLSWNKVEGAVKYNVYAHLSDMKEYGAAIVGTGSLSTEIGINAFLDYYVKVDACNSAGCISSSEIFVSRMKKEDRGTVVVPSPSTVTTTPSPNDSNIKELNKKVENLQNQLEESKQRQGALEARLNLIISWIKSIFPLFKLRD